jgi:sugar phosphate isomerase/epimerase
LYTVRDLMKADFEGTLAKVASVGYKEVEFAGYFDKSPGQVRHVLETHGLVSPSAHLPFESIAKGWEQVLDASQVIGHHYVTVAWIPEEARKDIDGWKRVGETLTKAGAACKAAGMEFCYHNHSYEFIPLEGQLPYDVVLASSDPELVKAELDLFWIANAGKDPFTYFARYPGRFPQVHVKDMAAGPGPDHQMVDVGQGIINWKKIFAQSEQAGIKHYYVEHDNPPHPLDDIRISYEYLKKLSF